MATVIGQYGYLSQNGWVLLNDVWNDNGLAFGINYTIQAVTDATSLTSGTTFQWSFPPNTLSWSAIRAYPDVLFGDSPWGRGQADPTHVFPIQLENLYALQASYNLNWAGDTGDFDVAYDIWFTSQPNGDTSTITNEVMIWLHKGNLSPEGQVLGTYNDGSFSGSFYHTGTYTAVVANVDTEVGIIDVAKVIQTLERLSIVEPTEYLASLQLGAEVVEGNGSLTIDQDDLSVVSDVAGIVTATTITGSGVSTPQTACFCNGTRIMTVRGEVAVERLEIGDRVVTPSGFSTIRWIGWRRMDLCTHPDRHLVQPVRIASGAFGAGCPARDLLVSPEHAVFIDDVLIPARHLVGCPGIAIDKALDRTTYYHIELSRHDVLLAEGLPCESWLDTGNRSMFDNGNVISLTGRGCLQHGTRHRPKGCAPLVVEGPVLDAIRRRLGAPHVHQVVIDATGCHVIAVPPGTGTVRMTSRAGYVAGDGRRLGVALSTIVLDGTRIGLGEPRLASGFHDAEPGWRWTDGRSELQIDVIDRIQHLRIDVAMVVSELAVAC